MASKETEVEMAADMAQLGLALSGQFMLCAGVAQILGTSGNEDEMRGAMDHLSQGLAHANETVRMIRAALDKAAQ